MLKPRIIPCLLIHNNGLVKTVRFKEPKYVGDPLNAVKIFNEKEVDELMILDIDATRLNKVPDFDLIKKLANESRMPLSYGGGVNSAEYARKIIGLGVEKVCISSFAVENVNELRNIAKSIGTQSLVIVIDVMKRGIFKKYEIVTNNATKNTGINPIDFAKKLEDIGIGELVINSVDQDGMMSGYDLHLVHEIRNSTSMPISVLGGAGSLSDIKLLFDKYKIIGAAAGSIFVFKGKYKAVLINYPTFAERKSLYQY